MRIKLSSDYETAEMREALTKFISLMVTGDPAFRPYRPNEHDDTFWKIDGGNDWSLTFSNDHPSVIELRYRYQCDRVPAEQAFVGWLVYKLNGEILS